MLAVVCACKAELFMGAGRCAPGASHLAHILVGATAAIAGDPTATSTCAGREVFTSS